MNKRSRILEALDNVVDDLSEERLLDILLDSYSAKKQRIKELESENARERQDLRDTQEQLREDMRRMRSDPFYGASALTSCYATGAAFGSISRDATLPCTNALTTAILLPCICRRKNG